MTIVDNHVHTSFSSDAKDSMEDVIKEAIKKGMKYLTITDHLENHLTDEWLNYEDYIKVFNYYKEKYKNEIELLLGIEIGYERSKLDDIKKLVSSYDFDFVICSTHGVEGKKIYNGSYFSNMTKKEAHEKYFNYILECTRNFTDFNIYGHLDYIVRYGPYEDKSINYEEYKDIIDEILINIIKNGSGIELNTSGFRYGLGAMHPNEYILKRYRQLGGTIITLGSDSHKAKDLCADFEIGKEILLNCGFENICVFKNRKAEFIEIKKEKEVLMA